MTEYKWILKTHLPLFINNYEIFFTFTTVPGLRRSTGKKNFLVSPLMSVPNFFFFFSMNCSNSLLLSSDFAHIR